eukprot:CAMPEP_0173310454 /NCGR_PEP_ID=MMETSP1143-20121109/22930_1 /TAXON_ID=483371 /ORGANISM="non described non described, Strain CCMP2298" /LENGTH=58 /DNA_ID=CAMNT_0014252229 /DNA_START=35 /DNA_END=208 /DNA_ORIENTATION=+
MVLLPAVLTGVVRLRMASMPLLPLLRAAKGSTGEEMGGVGAGVGAGAGVGVGVGERQH